jgi:uroporphyrinogen-III synthase
MKSLYLGLDPENFKTEGEIVHYPVIKILPKDPADPQITKVLKDLHSYTHVVFTSKNAVSVFLSYGVDLQKKMLIAIGSATALHLTGCILPKASTQEGIIELLKEMDLQGARFLLPGSSLARPLLARYLQSRGVETTVCPIYHTVNQMPGPIPDLSEVDEIVFTSPSTVDGFLKIYSALPQDKKLSCIGPITHQYLRNKISDCGNFLHSISSRSITKKKEKNHA